MYFNTPTAMSQQDMEIARAVVRNICQFLSLDFPYQLTCSAETAKEGQIVFDSNQRELYR